MDVGVEGAGGADVAGDLAAVVHPDLTHRRGQGAVHRGVVDEQETFGGGAAFWLYRQVSGRGVPQEYAETAGRQHDLAVHGGVRRVEVAVGGDLDLLVELAARDHEVA